MFDLQAFLQGGFFGRGWAGDRSRSTEVVRLLVVDGEGALYEKISGGLAPDVELIRTETFSDAEILLTEDPPDAVVFFVVPCFSMWRALIERCINDRPMIPFLCCARIEENPPCSCAMPCREEDMLASDTPMAEITNRINALIDEVRQPQPERFRPGRAALPDIEKLAGPQLDILS